ncbi:MAG: hypothetical protein ACRD0W_00225 [Acidimicrobiales bacterium]
MTLVVFAGLAVLVLVVAAAAGADRVVPLGCRHGFGAELALDHPMIRWVHADQ